MITVIGRGHSGTRAISHTLSQSGVYMGETLNPSGDMIPAQDLYEACRVMGAHVKYLGNLTWDFSRLHTMPLDSQFEKLVKSYLESVLNSSNPQKGWKLPETTLVYPWIIRMFPDTRTIFWNRDPRDCILGGHLTDNLSKFGIEGPEIENIFEQRAVSWIYQYQIVQSTPLPEKWIKIRFEDFVLDQEKTLEKLENFLEIPLVKIPVKQAPLGRWHSSPDHRDFDFLKPALKELGYISSSGSQNFCQKNGSGPPIFAKI